MKRFAAIVLFAGAVLVSTHILAPAAPPPPQAVVPATELAAIDQAKPVVDEVNAQVERLRERLANPPAYPAPTRDPFRFGTRAEPPRVTPAMSLAPLVEAATAPAPALPRLIAISSTGTAGDVVRSAWLAAGDNVQPVKVGDVFGKLVVRTISADVVELADPVSGTTFRISLH